MKKIEIRAALAAGWSAFMRRPWYILGLSLAFALLYVVSIGNALMTALAAVVYCGYVSMFIKHYRGGHIEFDDLFDIEGRWISYAFLMLIKSFFIILGLLLFIVPGVYLSVRWIFAEMLVVDQGMRPLEALRASSKMTQGSRWKLFGFVFVGSLLMLLGLFLFIVGALVAGIVLAFAMIKIYEDRKALLLETEPVIAGHESVDEVVA